MPYVVTSEREIIDRALETADPNELSAGQIAYFVYRILQLHCANARFLTYATAVGAVVLTLFRFVFVVVMPYEDRKRDENGDVL